MKYEHYFELKKSIPIIEPEALCIIEKIFEKHQDLVCSCSDFPESKPTYTDWEIYFDGKGTDGKQAFCFPPPRNIKAFSCRTGKNNYDIVVCEVLMVLKYFYKNLLRVTTTGDSIGWHKALDEITEFLPEGRFMIKNNNLRLLKM